MTHEERMFLYKKIRTLEDLLFSMGAMDNAPCFCCGYEGKGYYDPSIHSCAKIHHELLIKREKANIK